jgi:SprB repeat
LKQLSFHSLSGILLFIGIIFYSCSKGGGGGGGTTPDPCAGVTISVTGTATNPTGTSNNGGINTTASGGSSGFTYSINGGAFQSSGSFTNLAAGSYTVVAKNTSGCTGSATFTLTAPNLCAGVTITVTGTTVNPTSTLTGNGSINATAAGSSGFTFSVNGGAFQASGNFTNLTAGSYTIVAKDVNGCTGSAVFTLSAPNPCAGVTITVSAVVTGNRPCEPNNGSIVATVTGGTGPYTFSLNGGPFQASNNFINLGANAYTIAAKDANGCMGAVNATVNNASAGPLFLAVRSLLNSNCVSCHNPTVSEGGMSWTEDCNVINFKDRIDQRAVHGNPSAMPPTGLLPASERIKITNWINAGGRFSD